MELDEHNTEGWIRKDQRTWIQKFCANVIKQGATPKHVGFIMDGNRRFAKKHSQEKIHGHKMGFEKLTETLRWCLDFGITEVTVYVFSIENFKRSPEEVDGLMTLAKEKFHRLLQETDKLKEQGVCVQIIGDWQQVPLDLRPLMAKIMLETRHNSRAKLNVAFAYTSRNEITRGVKNVLRGIEQGDIESDDVFEETIEKTFQLLPSQPLDLLVRTSGETRLSDFMLWQSTDDTVIYFTEVLWPEFNYWNFLAAIFHYQLDSYQLMQLNLKTQLPQWALSNESKARIAKFHDEFQKDQWSILQEEAKLLSPS